MDKFKTYILTRKKIKLAIINNDINTALEFIKKDKCYNEYKYFVADYYLDLCIKNNKPQIYKIILEEKKYICLADLKNCFSDFHKEPFMSLVLDYLEQNPHVPFLDKIYPTILAYTLQWNYNKAKPRIQYLKNKCVDFEKNIQDPMYLYSFLKILFINYKQRKSVLNNVIHFFRQYIDKKKIISKELLIAIITANFFKKEIKIDNKNKDYLKGINLEYPIKLYNYGCYTDDKLYYNIEYYLYPNEDIDDNINLEYINKMNENVSEIPLGAYLRLYNKKIEDFNGENIVYEIKDSDKQKIDYFCNRFLVKNIDEDSETFINKIFNNVI